MGSAASMVSAPSSARRLSTSAWRCLIFSRMRWSLRQILLLGELQPHDIFIGGRRAVDGEARGVGTAMLEALQHRRHLLADACRAVTMNETGNSAHCRSLLSFAPPQLRQAIHIGPQIPFGHGVQEALPLIAFVLVIKPVHLSRHRRADDVVLLERGKRIAERHRQLLHLLAGFHRLIDVALLGLVRD